MTFVMSFSLFASEQNMSMEMKGVNMFPWQTSTTVCAASTRCPNGMIASCKVFGYAYNSMPGGIYNSCTWRVEALSLMVDLFAVQMEWPVKVDI